jgi:hypothetical protein
MIQLNFEIRYTIRKIYVFLTFFQRCNKTGHLARNCGQMNQAKCYSCGDFGHIASKCGLVS